MNGRRHAPIPLALLVLLALVAAALAFAISCLVLPAKLEVWSYGEVYADMAARPFAASSPFPHRILGPWLACGLGLGGDRYWIFHYATVLLFLALVCSTAMARGCAMLDAFLLTSIVAVTGAVEVFKGYVGYTEPLSFALLLASAHLTRHTRWFWLLQFVSLLNHENIVFLWPWLLVQKARDTGGLRRADWLGAAAALGGYLLARQLLIANPQALSMSFYLQDQKLSFIVGAWIMAVLAIVVYFGVLPSLLAWHAWHSGWRGAGNSISLVILAFFGMAFFANDLQRFVGFLAVPVVFAGIELLHRPRGTLVLATLGILTTAAIVLQRDVVRLVVGTMVAHPPDPVSALPTVIVPKLWYVFGGYALAHVAMLTIGRAWALRNRAESASDGHPGQTPKVTPEPVAAPRQEPRDRADRQ